MKKLNVLLYIILILLLSSLAYAVPLNDNDVDLMGWWKLDDAGATMTDSKTNDIAKWDLTYDGDTQQARAIATYSTNSLRFEFGDLDVANSSAIFGNLTTMKNYTILFWVDELQGDRRENIYAFTDSLTDGFDAFTQSDGSIKFEWFTGGAGDEILIGNIGIINQTLMTFRYNGTAYSVFYNTTEKGNKVANPTDFTFAARQNFTIGAIRQDTSRYDSLIEQFAIFNRSLSNAEITEYFNNGITVTALAGKPATPIIVAPSPENNANNNTNVTLNVTHSSTLNDVRYYLYLGTSTPTTEQNFYLFNVTRTGDEFRTFFTNLSDGTYFWKWKVENTTDGVHSANTTERTLIIDTVTPTIDILFNSSFKTDNTTIISNNITAVFWLNISFADLNLFQTLINITNESGDTKFSLLNSSMGGSSTANYSANVSLSNWGIGNYTIRLEATDSHTAKSISPYAVTKGLKYLRYTTGEGNIIKITSDTLPLTFRTDKLKDRYTFDFNYLFQENTYKFTIESYNKITYLPNSNYPAHFVILGDNGRGNWLDFGGINKKDIVVTRIDDYIYEVEITANGVKNFKFNSLGGLNRVEEHYKFRIGAVLDIWVFDEDNHPVQINATATIGTQSNNSVINTSGARLVNITRETTSLTLTSIGFGTEINTISITQSFHNFSFNMTPVSSARLYFFDEKSEALITDESFSVFLETTGFSQIFSGITNNPHSITGLNGGLYKLKASSTNYPERQYLDLNISNTTTTNLNIYLINNTLGTEILFNIVDEGLNPLEGVRTVFTKVINGSPTVVAEEVSDFAGLVALFLDEDVLYTINFSKTNYEDKTINLEPKNSPYIIELISTIGQYNQSVYEGIKYKFEPSNIILNNNTRYNFTFTLNSSIWDVTNCTLRLRNGTTLLNETSNFTSNSCFIRIEQNMSNMVNITSEAIYELDSQFQFTVIKQYKVIYTYEGDFSLKNFLDDLSEFAMAGFDNFGRMMLALIVIFIITALAAQKIGFANQEALIFLVIAQVWFFSFVNWLYLDFVPNIAGLRKYFIAILITLAGGAFVIEKFTK